MTYAYVSIRKYAPKYGEESLTGIEATRLKRAVLRLALCQIDNFRILIVAGGKSNFTCTTKYLR